MIKLKRTNANFFLKRDAENIELKAIILRSAQREISKLLGILGGIFISSNYPELRYFRRFKCKKHFY